MREFDEPEPKKPKQSWGIASSIGIYDRNPDTIRSAEKIKQFVKEVVAICIR
jgi:hypothetical protein